MNRHTFLYMNRCILITIVMSVMCVLPAAAIDYPVEGRIVAFHFNKSMADEIGNAQFTSKEFVPVWVEGADGKPETAVRFGPKPNKDGHSDFSGTGEMNLPASQTGVITAVMTYRTDEDQIFFKVIPDNYFSIKDGKLRYSAMRENSSKEDVHVIDLALKKGEWQTIVVTVTSADSTIAFCANGRRASVHNRFLAQFDPSKGGLAGVGSTSYNADIDELCYYDRMLTDSEISVLIGGKIEPVESVIDTGSIQMNWGWALVQLAAAALCLFFLNLKEKRLVVHTAESLAQLQHEKNCLQFDRDESDRLMAEAYNYWGGPDKANATDLLPTHYPETKKEMKASLRAYNQSLLLADSNDEEFILMAQGFARAYNAANVRVFNGKWLVVLAAVVAVFVKGIIGATGFFGTSSVTGMPDGFLAQIWFISKFMLPGVMVSAVAYVACSFGPRWRNLKESLTIMPKHLKDSESTRRRKLIAACIICGGSLLSMFAGAVAGVAALALLVAVVGYAALNIFANNSTQKEVWVYNNGRRETHETLNPTGLLMAGGIIVVAIIVVYFASSIVIFLFNLAFIYKFIQNQLIKN